MVAGYPNYDHFNIIGQQILNIHAQAGFEHRDHRFGRRGLDSAATKTGSTRCFDSHHYGVWHGVIHGMQH